MCYKVFKRLTVGYIQQSTYYPFSMPASLFNKLVLDQVGIAAIRFLLSLNSLKMALTIKRKLLQH